MTNLASASDTKFDSNNQLKYLSYQNCQENFLNCLLNISNINNQHNNYEQQHSENSFRLLNSDSFIISNKDLYFDSTNSNQPELKRVKVNLDTITASNFDSKTANKQIYTSLTNENFIKTSSVKQLVYKRINESKIALNIKTDDQLKLDDKTKCSFVNRNQTNVYGNPYLVSLVEQSNWDKLQFQNQITKEQNETNYFNNNRMNLNRRFNSKNIETMQNFHDLQKANVHLRQLLKQAKRETQMEHIEYLAFTNLTYLSSDEDDTNLNKLGQETAGQLNSEFLKKTLKSIKRKDRLKKQTETLSLNKELAKSMPDLTMIAMKQQDAETVLETKSKEQISNIEYEKMLRKQYRNKSFSRSLRRAKSVYYRNIRSKSLEDLTNEERADYLMKAAANFNKIKMLKKTSRSNSITSINSCSSTTSNAISISSSHFRELNDWSPEFSSYESDSSEDELDNFDWDANLSLSQFDLNGCDSQSSSSSENEDDYEILLNKDKIMNCKLLPIKLEEPKEMQLEKLSLESVEKMMNEIMVKMINLLHTDLNCIKSLNSDPSEFITNIKHTVLKANDVKFHNNCSICSIEYEQEDEVTSTDCAHTFHKFCLKFWLTKSNKCPSCCYQNQNSKNAKSFVPRETLL